MAEALAVPMAVVIDLAVEAVDIVAEGLKRIAEKSYSF